MAKDTPITYRSLVIYEIYIRNHGPLGTFTEVETDLERIKALGVDVIWFMPIHPIGQVAHKGTLGSPYSIANYREVNPAYGSKADFARLVKKAHQLSLKVMIDVVYNHTAHDSNLVKDHPGWYHQNAMGQPFTTVPEWSDVIDLKFPNSDLEDYLLETLAGWVEFGIDGFRCDVASLLPEDFWLRARARCANINPQVIWLAESVDAGWVDTRRRAELSVISDSEVFRAFDLEYDYDIWHIWQAAVVGIEPVSRYLEMLHFQDCIYPANFMKMRCVENHDQIRIMRLAPSSDQAMAWTAFEAFNQGPFLIYDGQEAAARHTPSLFDIDKIEWGSYLLSPFLSLLSRLKKDPAVASGLFTVSAAEPAVIAEWEAPGACLIGIFNVGCAKGKIRVPLPDGEYQDLLNGIKVQIQGGELQIPSVAAILRYTQPAHPEWFYSTMFNLNIPREAS